MKLKLYPCGTIVTIKLTKIEGIITCQSIRFDKVNYEITYYVNDEQRTILANEAEFETSAIKQPIGFQY